MLLSCIPYMLLFRAQSENQEEVPGEEPCFHPIDDLQVACATVHKSKIFLIIFCGVGSNLESMQATSPNAEVQACLQLKVSIFKTTIISSIFLQKTTKFAMYIQMSSARMTKLCRK